MLEKIKNQIKSDILQYDRNGCDVLGIKAAKEIYRIFEEAGCVSITYNGKDLPITLDANMKMLWFFIIDTGNPKIIVYRIKKSVRKVWWKDNIDMNTECEIIDVIEGKNQMECERKFEQRRYRPSEKLAFEYEHFHY